MTDSWKGDERRSPEGLVLTILRHVEEIIEANNRTAEDRFQRIEARLDALMQSVGAFIAKFEFHTTPCERLKDAVPNGDIKKHHDYHAGLIDWDDKVRDVKLYVIKVTVAAGVIGFATWLGALAWLGFLRGPA